MSPSFAPTASSSATASGTDCRGGSTSPTSTPAADLTLHIVPITAASLIDLDASARERVRTAGRLCEIDRIDLVVSSRWTEPPV